MPERAAKLNATIHQLGDGFAGIADGEWSSDVAGIATETAASGTSGVATWAVKRQAA